LPARPRRGITWEDSAKADVRAIDQATAMRILRGISRFLETGYGDVIRLQGIEPPEHRLRIGEIFHDLGKSIDVISVKHPSEAYR
jgi:hypothetical protein